MLGPEALLCAPAAALLFADASEVPPSNKAAATTIRLGFVMIFLQSSTIQPSRQRLRMGVYAEYRSRLLSYVNLDIRCSQYRQPAGAVALFKRTGPPSSAPGGPFVADRGL